MSSSRKDKKLESDCNHNPETFNRTVGGKLTAGLKNHFKSMPRPFALALSSATVSLGLFAEYRKCITVKAAMAEQTVKVRKP